jgi:phosphoribosylformimino-5-aminoimidazole carboxamide ribotide isomerase
MQIIPAIDIIDGKCVRLSKGDYSTKTVYHADPLDAAKMFESWGLTRLHLVDLDGAKAAHIVNYQVLRRIATETKLVIDFGGGLKTDGDIRIAFENGAEMVTGGSIAVKNPVVFLDWLNTYGPQKIILGADHRGGRISTSGWTEDSNHDVFDFIAYYLGKGLKKVISTDIDRDGMLEGASNTMYARMLQRFPEMELIASGGVATLSDLLSLRSLGLSGCIVGKAFYEGRIGKKEIERYTENLR